MAGNFYSPEGDLEKYFVTESWLVDKFIGDQLWVWGQQGPGSPRLGTNDLLNWSIPVTTFSGGSNWKQVSCGNGGWAAIKLDGTLWTVGIETSGAPRLGNDLPIASTQTPITVFGGGNNWVQVSSSVEFRSTMAIKSDGTLWGWGQNEAGSLGVNNSTIYWTPVTTFAGGTNWKQVSCGRDHSAAIKTDGSLWTWGSNVDGQLGTFDSIYRGTPVTTFAGGNDWKQVSCGGYKFVMAVKTDGSLWGWGNGNSGRLGNNLNATRVIPVTTFSGGNNWKQVSCGYTHSAAIKTDGSLWTWGVSSLGRLGNNTTSTITGTPVTTFAGGNNWKQVSCGGGHTGAIKTDGTLWVWGYNIDGRLGTNDAIDKSTPVTTFAGGSDWKQVSAGTVIMAAIKSGIAPELPLS